MVRGRVRVRVTGEGLVGGGIGSVRGRPALTCGLAEWAQAQ